MSLITDADLILTPTGWESDLLNLAKPNEDLPSGIDEVTNGTFDSAASWTLDSAWSIGSGVATLNANNNNPYIMHQSGVTLGGRTYRLFYEITSYTDGALDFGTSTAASYGALNTAVGSHTLDFTATSSTIGFHAAGTKPTMSIDNVRVEELPKTDPVFYRGSVGKRRNATLGMTEEAAQIPRIQYDVAGEGHFIMEPQLTNLEGTSYMNSGGTLNNVTRTTGQTDVQVETNGILLTSSNAGGSGTANMKTNATYGVVVSSKYSASVFAKANGTKYVGLKTSGFTTPGDVITIFDVTGGTVFSTGAGHTAYIEEWASGWYRIGISFTTDAADTTGDMLVCLCDNATGSETVTYDASDTAYFYGFQFEAWPHPTSYIETTGIPATRIDDELYLAGRGRLDELGPIVNSEDHVLYAEIRGYNDDVKRDITIGDQTVNNRVCLSFNASNQLAYEVKVGGAVQFSGTLPSIDITQWNKIAIKVKLNDMAIWVNGTEEATTGSASTFAAATIDNLSCDDQVGANPFFGDIRLAIIFGAGLTDTQLQNITT